MTETFDKLLHEIRDVFETIDALNEFCELPQNLAKQSVSPHFIPAARLFENDTGLYSPDFTKLRDAIIKASSDAQWRETYKNTHIAELFREKFGCYCVIGEGGPFTSDKMGAYIVYMPKDLYYPFHHHPAEELYFIIAGEAEFLMEDKEPKRLGPGEHVFHPSNHPHATKTHDHPFLALVLWRGDMSVAPVLTNPKGDA